MAMDITQSLLSFMSVDATERNEAMATLKKFEKESRPYYLLSLATELANDGKPDSRRLAGVILEDLLPKPFYFPDKDNDANDNEDDDADKDEDEEEARLEAEAICDNLNKMWFDMDMSVRSQIKELLLKTLGSVQIAPQLISRIALVEQIAFSEYSDLKWAWPDFFQAMRVNISQPNKPAALATLEVLERLFRFDFYFIVIKFGAAYEDIRSTSVGIAQLMNGTEKSPQVYLAATRVLNNIGRSVIPFPYLHKDRVSTLKRDVLAKVICETTLVEDPHIRHSAMECFRWFTVEYYYYKGFYEERVSDCAQGTRLCVVKLSTRILTSCPAFS